MSTRDNIIGKIAINAKMRWDKLSKSQAEAIIDMYNSEREIRDCITYGSEINAVNGIEKICTLTEAEKDKLLFDIYNNNQISKELAEKIRIKITENMEDNILEILSNIHDEWVKNNGNKFQARKKDYQFVDLRLLPFSEVESDLIFLQPILEACGIDIDIIKLKETFSKKQNEFILQNDICSHEQLVEFLKAGSENYFALNGITSNSGDKVNADVNIDSLLKTEKVAEEMAIQIETCISCKTDLHTHINGILPSKKLAQMSYELLGETVNQDLLEIQENVGIFNRMQEAYAERKKIIDKLLSKGYGQNFINAIAEELTEHSIFYTEITADKEILNNIQQGKINVDLIEKQYGIQLRFLLGINRNGIDNLETFDNEEIQKLFGDLKYLKGIDIMRIRRTWNRT